MKDGRIMIQSTRWMAVVGLLVWSAGCGGEQGSESGGAKAEQAEEAGHGHGEEAEKEAGEEAGHGHGSKEAENEPLEKLAEARCEHGIPQMECDECRYELGLVKVPKDQQEALLAVEEVKSNQVQSPTLELRCEAGRSAAATSTVTAQVSGRVQRIHRVMGEQVKVGDPLITVLSDEYARLRLEHQKAHQKLEYAKARQAQFEKTQASLRVLLEKLGQSADVSVAVADLSGMPLGKSKAELLEASSQHSRALAEWKRFERLEADTGSLVRKLRNGGGGVDGLKVGEAKGRLLEAKADLSLAEKSYQRAKALSGEGVVAQNELERAARDLEAAQAHFRASLEQAELDLEEKHVVGKESLESARARLQGAMEQAILDADLQLLEVKQELERRTSEVEVAHRQLTLLGLSENDAEKQLAGHSEAEDTLEIRSPVNGVIVSVSATVGQTLEKGQALTELADLTKVWVWCDVYEKDLALLAEAKLPLPALIRSDAFAERSFPGQLDYLAPDSDATSRTVKARVTASSDGLLRPGMYLRTSVATQGESGGLWLPEGAVMQDGDAYFVFVKWGEEFFVRRNVEVGEASGKRRPVFSGIAAGDQVVIRGAFYLKSDILREKMGAGCAD